MHLKLIGLFVVILLLIYIYNRHGTSCSIQSTRNEHTQPTCNSQCDWTKQKSKCFSCLKQTYHTSGGDTCAVARENPIKYYERTPTPGMGYAKMGYLAF